MSEYRILDYIRIAQDKIQIKSHTWELKIKALPTNQYQGQNCPKLAPNAGYRTLVTVDTYTDKLLRLIG